MAWEDNEMIWEDDQGQEGSSLEYPFLFDVELPSLQQLASYRVCELIWITYFSSGKASLSGVSADTAPDHENNFNRLVENLNIPSPCEKMVKKDAQYILDNLVDWSRHVNRELLVYVKQDGYEREKRRLDLNWCEWLYNGEIDYRKSALKMIRSEKLNETRKFIVASKYSMEDEMKTMSRDWLTRSVKTSQEFNANPLHSYWVRYLENEKLKDRHDLRLLNNDLLEDIARKCFICCLNSFEYVWHNLTNGIRVSIIRWCFRNPYVEIHKLQWRILERLMGPFPLSIFHETSLCDVSYTYLRYSLLYSESTQHQLRLWHRFKDYIDDTQFDDIVDVVYRCRIHCEGRIRALMSIWDAADDHHKEYAAENSATTIVETFVKCHQNEKPPGPAAYEFFWRVLAALPESDRSELLVKHAAVVAKEVQRVETLDKMFDVYLSSVDDRAKFKLNVSNSRELLATCVSLFQQGNLIQLNLRLRWVFPENDSTAAKKLLEKVFTTVMKWKYLPSVEIYFASIHKWNELSHFVDQTHAPDVQAAIAIKTKLINETTPVLGCGTRIHRDFNLFQQIVESIIPSMAQFKSTHLKSLEEHLKNEVYWRKEQTGDEIFLQNFVEWCCDYNQQLILQFKNSIPLIVVLHGVFSKLAHDCGWTLKSVSQLETLLHRLENHLKWFLGSDELVRESKLRAIEQPFVEMNVFTNLMQRSAAFTEECVELILKWIFSGDEMAIGRFRAEVLEKYRPGFFINDLEMS